MAISRPVDVDELEKGVRQSIDTVHVRIPLPTLCECEEATVRTLPVGVLMDAMVYTYITTRTGHLIPSRNVSFTSEQTLNRDGYKGEGNV